MNSKSIKLLSKLVLATLLLPTMLFGQAGVLYNQTTKDVMQTNLNRFLATGIVAQTSIGIGVTNPSARLQVTNPPNSTTQLLRAGTNENNGLTVQAGGLVGVGTTNPRAPLHVTGEIIASVTSSNAVTTTNGTTSRQLAARFGDVFNVRDFGALGDARKVDDGRTVNADSNVYSMTINFTARDVGKKAWAIQSAAGLARLPLGTIVTVVNATNAIVNTNAGASLSSLSLVIGTDDTDAIRAAVTAASNINGRVYLPAGGYVFSKLLIQLEYSADTGTITFEGDGASKTVLYPSPAYDFTPIGLSYGMLHKVLNAANLRLLGFSIDPSRFTFSNSVALINATSARTHIRDVRLVNHFNTGLAVTSTGQTVEKVHVESCGGAGIVVNGGAAVDIYSSYFGNNTSYNVDCYAITGTNNGGGSVRFFGGIIDEGGATSCFIRNNSSDVSFLGTKIFSAQSQYAVTIEGGSRARFVGTEITPYLALAGQNRGGLRVLSGGMAYLSSCRVDGLGTNTSFSYAITNAGTIYDGGNNSIGAGTIGLGVTNNGTILASNIANVVISGSINAKTNIANYSFATNFMTLNTRYTNNSTLLGSRRSFLWANVAVTNITPVGLFVDQDADGTYEENYNVVVSDSVGVTNILHLSDALNPGAFFVITNFAGSGTMGVFSSKLTGL